MVFIRGGQQIGDQTFFPVMPEEQDGQSLIEAFIGLYYLGKPIPREILVSESVEDPALLEEMLTAQAGHSVRISGKLRGERARRVQLALTNAESALTTKLANRQDMHARFLALGQTLQCAETPKRLECFDISHTQGELTVASCVVFDQQGPVKSAYRRFNIEGIQPGDDYAALAQAVTRRYRRIREGEFDPPDILLVDGGKGQVKAVMAALDDLGMASIKTLGVAKGPDRKPGMEVLIPAESTPAFMLPSNSPALLLIQQIRDEAHRFAITGHRQRRAKARKQSTLEGIPGLGIKRRQQLLRQFGGVREISRAGVDALSRIDGISLQLAQRIYDTFHEQEN
jgi:excinuclease ABC subunit C